MKYMEARGHGGKKNYKHHTYKQQQSSCSSSSSSRHPPYGVGVRQSDNLASSEFRAMRNQKSIGSIEMDRSVDMEKINLDKLNMRSNSMQQKARHETPPTMRALPVFSPPRRFSVTNSSPLVILDSPPRVQPAAAAPRSPCLLDTPPAAKAGDGFKNVEPLPPAPCLLDSRGHRDNQQVIDLLDSRGHGHGLQEEQHAHQELAAAREEYSSRQEQRVEGRYEPQRDSRRFEQKDRLVSREKLTQEKPVTKKQEPAIAVLPPVPPSLDDSLDLSCGEFESFEKTSGKQFLPLPPVPVSCSSQLSSPSPNRVLSIISPTMKAQAELEASVISPSIKADPPKGVLPLTIPFPTNVPMPRTAASHNERTLATPVPRARLQNSSIVQQRIAPAALSAAAMMRIPDDSDLDSTDMEHEIELRGFDDDDCPETPVANANSPKHADVLYDFNLY